MNWTKKSVLQAWQRANPVMISGALSDRDMAGACVATDAGMEVIFPGGKHSLKTWGRTPGVKVDDPHWIGVCNPGPMHTDPAYPRYTHHLVLRADGFFLRGIDGQPFELARGIIFTLDTHSPHQIFLPHKLARGERPRFYLASSIDAKLPYHPNEMREKLLKHARTAELFTPEITSPNNGGRWQK